MIGLYNQNFVIMSIQLQVVIIISTQTVNQDKTKRINTIQNNHNTPWPFHKTPSHTQPTSFFLLPTRRPHPLRRLRPRRRLHLFHHLLLIHLFRIVNVHVWSFFLGDHALFLLIVIEDDWQVLEDVLWDLVPLEVLDGALDVVQVHRDDVLLTETRVVVAAGYGHSALHAEGGSQPDGWTRVGLGIAALLDNHPVVETLVELQSMLDGSDFLDGAEVLDYHVD